MSSWIKKELRGGKHYPGGDEEVVENTLRDLNVEFKKSHGELSQKVFNVPKLIAKEISEAYDVPLALGMIAFQIETDGILSAKIACELLRREYLRLKATEDAIPLIESLELDFSIREGQWIEYLFKKYARQINDKTGIMTTIRGILNSKDLPLEKILMIVQERDKITRGLIAPILHEWVSSHRKTTAFQGALAMAEAILKAPNDLEKAKLAVSSQVKEVRAILERLKSTLEASDFSSWSSREIEPVKRNISHLDESIRQMNSSVESMSETGLAELVAELIPTKGTSYIPLEKGDYLTVTSPIPKSGAIAPLLDNPYDFLERDIRLAGQRDDSREFMRKTVEKVYKALAESGKPNIDIAINMITQMHDRFGGTNKLNKEELFARLESFVRREETEDLNTVEKIDFNSLYDFISNYFLESFVKPRS